MLRWNFLYPEAYQRSIVLIPKTFGSILFKTFVYLRQKFLSAITLKKFHYLTYSFQANCEVYVKFEHHPTKEVYPPGVPQKEISESQNIVKFK